MKLVRPSTDYKESFLQALEEYRLENDEDRLDILSLDQNELEEKFGVYITRLQEESDGKHLPHGYVPQTTYWLIDQNEFIGRVNIRHSLTPFLSRIGGHIGYDIRPSKRKLGYGIQILKIALPKAKELGLVKALITCNETNIGSKKIIEANGGIFENSESQENGLPNKLRYWIPLS